MPRPKSMQPKQRDPNMKKQKKLKKGSKKSAPVNKTPRACGQFDHRRVFIPIYNKGHKGPRNSGAGMVKNCKHFQSPTVFRPRFADGLKFPERMDGFFPPLAESAVNPHYIIDLFLLFV